MKTKAPFNTNGNVVKQNEELINTTNFFFLPKFALHIYKH